MTEDETIDKLWEQSNHGTRREDVVAAFNAGIEAACKPWEPGYICLVEPEHVGTAIRECVIEITRLRKIEAAAVEVCGLPNWNNDTWINKMYALDAALKEG